MEALYMEEMIGDNHILLSQDCKVYHVLLNGEKVFTTLDEKKAKDYFDREVRDFEEKELLDDPEDYDQSDYWRDLELEFPNK